MRAILIDRSVNDPLEGKRNVVARIRVDDGIQSGWVTRVACFACMARLLEINLRSPATLFLIGVGEALRVRNYLSLIHI